MRGHPIGESGMEHTSTEMGSAAAPPQTNTPPPTQRIDKEGGGGDREGLDLFRGYGELILRPPPPISVTMPYHPITAIPSARSRHPLPCLSKHSLIYARGHHPVSLLPPAPLSAFSSASHWFVAHTGYAFLRTQPVVCMKCFVAFFFRTIS